MKRFLLILPAHRCCRRRPLRRGCSKRRSSPRILLRSDADLAFSRTRGSGATTVRLQLSWRRWHPTARQNRPASIPRTLRRAYRWGGFDRLVQRAVANGLEPFIGIIEAPTWAETASGGRAGTNRPDPVEFGRFAEATARRFGGGFPGLPRVKLWEVWNEANASFFLHPQKAGSGSLSPSYYRRMVNEFAAGAKRVHPDNRVVAGGLFPLVIDGRPHRRSGAAFHAQMLCLRSGGSIRGARAGAL